MGISSQKQVRESSSDTQAQVCNKSIALVS